METASQVKKKTWSEVTRTVWQGRGREPKVSWEE